jgi:two-component system, cell cycle sensor histidine kinase and response regulator CckA
MANTGVLGLNFRLPQSLSARLPRREQRTLPCLLALLLALMCVPLPAFADPSPDGPSQAVLWPQARLGLALLALIIGLYLFWNLKLRGELNRRAADLEAALGELRARTSALHSLLEMGGSPPTSTKEASLLNQTVEAVRTGTGARRIELYLPSEGGGLRLAATAPADSCDRPGERPSWQKFLADWTPDSVRSAPTINEGNRSGCIPLRVGEREVGYLVAERAADARVFREADLVHLQGFADEIALALEHARLKEEAAERQIELASSNRELQALVAFSTRCNTARTPEDVARLIRSTIVDGLGFDRAGIFLLEGDSLRGTVGTDEAGNEERLETTAEPLPKDGKWIGLLSGEHSYIFTENAYAEMGARTPGGKPVGNHVWLALRTQEQLLGLVAVDNVISNRPIGQADIGALADFARQASTALQSVQLIDALSNSEERLRDLVTSLSETLYSIRVGRGVLIPIFYSPQIEHLTGYTAMEALATSDFWWHRVHPEDRAHVSEGLDEILRGKPSPIEYRIYHRDGTERWVLDTPAVLTDSDGSVSRINGTMLDISERKRLEERLRRAQKMETVGTLAGGIAHDFNTLLAIIRGNAEMAKMDVEDDHPAAFSLSQSLIAVDRAANLVKQLLTFSRETVSRKAQIVLDDIVQETVPLLKASLGKDVSLEVRTDEDVLPVFADAGQMQQVLINLCVNARDAMPEGGVITVRTQNVTIGERHREHPNDAPPGSYVRLQVRDTGAGMDAATRDRIFEPFFTTKPVGRGTGLGLAVAYGIATEHRGWIEVESDPGKGTVFSVYLPVAEAAIAAEEHAPVTAAPRTVLVVEPDISERERIVAILEDAGYETITAEDNSDALALIWADAGHVDAVIADGSGVGMDAAQFIQNLRIDNGHIAVLLNGREQPQGRLVPDGSLASIPRLQRPHEVESIMRAVSAALADRQEES